MGKHLFGTVRVPSAGLVLEVVTHDETPERVSLHASRFGMWQVAGLSRDEAWQLSELLRAAALSIKPAGVVQ